MLDKMVRFALNQRVFVVLVIGALLLVGGYAVGNLPVEAFPDVQDVQVQIITAYPSGAPEEVERMVSRPIEAEMSGVPRITQLRSVSMTGLSVVTLLFSDGTDDYFARQQVLEKLQNVSLPPGTTPQLAPLTTAVGEVFRYTLRGPAGMPLSELRTLQDTVVRPALRRVPGIADVVTIGGALLEVQVRARPDALTKFGISLSELQAALAKGSANAGGGVLVRGDEALVVRSLGLFTSLTDVRRTVVAARNGTAITVDDLAEVAWGERERSGIVALDRDNDVVEGIVNMIRGQDPAKVIASLAGGLKELESRLPKGVHIERIYDRRDLIEHTVHTVAENMLVGAVLVVAILVLFLRNWAVALIVASVIPLSLLTAFTLMHLKGMSANLISLGAVDFGIIIDSAVVLVEALMVRLTLDSAEGAARSDPAHRLIALRQTATAMGHPIVFSKGIIVLAFLPIFTFQRVEGKIFSPMAFTLSFALAGAVVLTLTWVPTMLAFLLGRRTLLEKHLPWMDRLKDQYMRSLLWCRERSRMVIVGSVSVLGAALLLVPLLGSEFLPKLDEGNLWITLSLPPSSSMASTRAVESRLRAILLETPEVRKVVTHIGRPDDGTDPKGPNSIEMLADLKPRGTWRFADKEALIAHLAGRMTVIPGVHPNFSQIIQDNVEEALSGGKGELAIKIFGPDLEVLSQKADQVASVLSGIRGAADVEPIRISGLSEVSVLPDRDRLARYGVTIEDFNAVVETALGGRTVNTFYEARRNANVTLRFDRPYRDAIEAVGRLPVALPGGGSVPLSELASVSVRQGPTRISREAGGRMVHIKANLRGRDQGSFVAEAQDKVARTVHLPQGYSMTWGGQFENQQRALKRLLVVVPLSLGGIFVLLFWAFRSVLRATLVLAMVPFTLIGGFVALGLAGMHLSISAAVGFIAVAGICVQNGVILVEEVQSKLDNGLSRSQAIVQGAVVRLRPILMTALMAGLGLLPAALSHGIGSETQRPFALVIVGGIISATVFTLLLLPTLLGVFEPESEA
ncbi:CusA/CzcA family heavy metal efflux RND transporter [uncultured Aquabacterium sp.]|uniref:efflux RND transporter permease subunit n=1 Tax=uncultured Aquabacterium sp. TaxID=158753 RepID=UPI00260E3875|nr:CusA/CzcA family heavy metal efflux RND transporter [uncultured Aquabacterium sp.]